MKGWTPEEIEAFRREYKITRRKLGELTGVTVSSIYQWERGLKQTSNTVKILLSRIEEDFQRERKKKGEKQHG
jgi:DNA-binding transcriptional regulator YiaG